MPMVAALPSLLNHSSSTIRLVELITWQWLLHYCTISSQLFLLYHQVSWADYNAMVAALPSLLNHSSSTIRLVELITWQWLLLYHLFSNIPPLLSGKWSWVHEKSCGEWHWSLERMVATLTSLLNQSSSTIRLVELVTWQWLLLYHLFSTIPPLPSG